MEILLRRLLGLYLRVSAVAFLPAALFYLDVENTAGPWWILPAVPMAQAVVFAVAGFLLSRQPAPAIPLESGIVLPVAQALLQLLGVYFIVEGLSSAVRHGVDMLIFTQGWITRLGHFAADAVRLSAGWITVMRPEIVLRTVRERQRFGVEMK